MGRLDLIASGPFIFPYLVLTVIDVNIRLFGKNRKPAQNC